MKELRFCLSPSTVCLCFFVCFFEGVGSGVGRAQASKASPNVVCTVGVLPAFSHISGPYFPGGFLSILLAPPPTWPFPLPVTCSGLSSTEWGVLRKGFLWFPQLA